VLNDQTDTVLALLSLMPHTSFTGPLLACAVNSGSVASLQLLLGAKWDPNGHRRTPDLPRHTPPQKSPLWYAATRDRADVLRILLAARADANRGPQHPDHSPVSAAARDGNMAALAVLLSAKAPVDCVPRNSLPATYEAAIGGHWQAVRVLLAAGAETPLFGVMEHCGVRGVKLLLRAKADATCMMHSLWQTCVQLRLQLQTKRLDFGSTPNDFARCARENKCWHQLVWSCERVGRVAELLLRAKADVGC
jgi:ankyrin repeat protein